MPEEKETASGTQASREDNRAAASGFYEASVPLAISPTYINRFQFFDMPHGITMVVGSALGRRQKDASIKPYLRPLASYLFDRDLAIAMVVGLQDAFDLTPQEIESGGKSLFVEKE